MFRVPASAVAIAAALAACGGGRDDCAPNPVSTSSGLPPWSEQTAMVIVSPDIYWATGLFGVEACLGGGLYVAPLAGGRSTQVSSDCVLSLTLATDTMFWISSPLFGSRQPARLWSASLRDPSVVHHSDLPRFLETIHSTSNSLLGAGTDGLAQVAPDGTFPDFLVQNSLGVSTGSVASDARNAYYIRTDFNATVQQVVKSPLAGGPSQVIASAPCNSCLSHLAVESGSLLWIEKEIDLSTFVATGAVMRASSAGGPVTELARPSGSAPGGLAVFAGYFYWTNLDFASHGSVMKTPLAGGPATTVVAAREWLGSSVAVDDRYVYFLGIAPGADPNADPSPDQVVYRACR